VPTYTINASGSGSLVSDAEEFFPGYSAARAGTEEVNTVTGEGLLCGQNRTGGGYRVYQSFVAFDLEDIPAGETILAVTLKLYGDNDEMGANKIIDAYSRDWGSTLTVVDFVPGATLASLTKLASLHGSGFIDGGYNTFISEAGFVGAIVPGGMLRIVLAGADQRTGVAPSASEYLDFLVSGSPPRLEITTSKPGKGRMFNGF